MTTLSPSPPSVTPRPLPAQRLFDLYFFTVVTSFVPQLALHSLFSHFEALEAAASGGAGGGFSGRPGGGDNMDAYTFRDPMCTCSLCASAP
jgi:hypothetical protein